MHAEEIMLIILIKLAAIMNFTHEHLKNNVTMFLFGMSLLYQDLPTQKQTENINDDISTSVLGRIKNLRVYSNFLGPNSKI